MPTTRGSRTKWIHSSKGLKKVSFSNLSVTWSFAGQDDQLWSIINTIHKPLGNCSTVNRRSSYGPSGTIVLATMRSVCLSRSKITARAPDLPLSKTSSRWWLVEFYLYVVLDIMLSWYPFLQLLELLVFRPSTDICSIQNLSIMTRYPPLGSSLVQDVCTKQKAEPRNFHCTWCIDMRRQSEP